MEADGGMGKETENIRGFSVCVFTLHIPFNLFFTLENTSGGSEEEK